MKKRRRYNWMHATAKQNSDTCETYLYFQDVY